MRAGHQKVMDLRGYIVNRGSSPSGVNLDHDSIRAERPILRPTHFVNQNSGELFRFRVISGKLKICRSEGLKNFPHSSFCIGELHLVSFLDVVHGSAQEV